ncbi:hypothetical protein SELMODRAFT_439932 [Selaginella moellendorffii]|uniref:Anamorsin homolog n=1 Tax=Selaginella moellendorffii TaxID=88036 RepID=D8R8D5_SELML|nr:anamorsin homolog 2 [Selaginella moellendorffii]XP_024527784.1 anamorsin homolog 2 [Selaginella moellendorffii]EFJ32043.1 hypothetical protein SELMODRAFT_439932 [Selaginella moellendorffii]|eukprot:XP_002967444.1 anamorsin homolog 2 [Selaginella moellendorffii]
MVGEPVVLLVTDAAALPGSAVVWAMSAFADKAALGKSLAISTHASQFGGKLKQSSSSLEVVISLGIASLEWVKEVSRVLKPGGILVVRTSEDKAAVQRSLVLAGFVSIETMEPVEGLSLADGLSGISLSDSVLLRAQKPAWEAGVSFPIKRKAVAAQDTAVERAVTSNGSSAIASWKLPTVDLDEDDFDLVDEDSLLTEEDLKRPELPAADDCEVGNAGRKACKNCTCGRAELEEEGKLPDELLNNPISQCGSCGLGDAFRCGTCPYRGLPPFKLGEKITLSGTLLTADV